MKEVKSYVAMKQSGTLLNANESSTPIPTELKEEILAALSQADWNRYPDDSMACLYEAYGKYVGVDANCVIGGNGSDEMLGLLIGTCLQPNDSLYTVGLDFSMYDYYASSYSANVAKYPYGVELPFDVKEFIQFGKENSIKMIMISNPNNPTGQIYTTDEIIQILEAYPDIPVVIDEAYGEFYGNSMIPYIDRYPNLIVTRTVSKAFALAGIRCGFAISNAQTIARLRTRKVPYNMNVLTQLCATFALQDVTYMKKYVQSIVDERERMYQAICDLKRTDLKVYPSYTNYLYGKSSRKEELLKAMEKADIVIRNYADDSFRITIGTVEENNRVLEVIKQF